MIHTFGTTTVETAAESAEELAFLAEIMADQLDVTRKLVYADWLEERGDPRGRFLREFARAASAPGAQLPHTDDFSLSWLQVVGVHPLTLIRQNITGRHLPFLENNLMQ